jgi:hypothetical protein
MKADTVAEAVFADEDTIVFVESTLACGAVDDTINLSACPEVVSIPAMVPATELRVTLDPFTFFNVTSEPIVNVPCWLTMLQ